MDHHQVRSHAHAARFASGQTARVHDPKCGGECGRVERRRHERTGGDGALHGHNRFLASATAANAATGGLHAPPAPGRWRGSAARPARARRAAAARRWRRRTILSLDGRGERARRDRGGRIVDCNRALIRDAELDGLDERLRLRGADAPRQAVGKHARVGRLRLWRDVDVDRGCVGNDGDPVVSSNRE